MFSPIKLIPSDSSLVHLCQDVQHKLSHVRELQNLSIHVVLEQDFSGLPEAERSQVMRDTCAAYRRSTNTIHINKSTFNALQPIVMEAVLAHEIGHAHAHHCSLMDTMPQYKELGNYGEEFLADRLACLWGFEDGLCLERESSYKSPYVKALKTWPDEVAYCEAMGLWRMQRLAGIV
ncbi:MAG: M48 family metalloprotease [Arenimonas sp.]